MELVKYILEGISDKNPSDINGITPLHLAAKNGSLDIFELIASNELITGINPRAFDESSPLSLAVDFGHQKIARYLAKKL